MDNEKRELAEIILHLLQGFMDEIMAILEIDEFEKPNLRLHMDDEKDIRVDGQYCHATNTVSLNSVLVAEAIEEVGAESKNKTGSSVDKLRGPKMCALVRDIAHELKHREQHLHPNEKFKDELALELSLDLRKPEDFARYSTMNIEFDARAFSRIGAAIVLKEWESFYDPQYQVDADDQRYAEFLVDNLRRYKDWIPEDIMGKILPPGTKLN